MKSLNKNFVLGLSIKTWIRDSHGLYDYESHQTKNLNAILAESIYIARKKHDILALNNIQELKKDEEELLFNVLNENKDEYVLKNEVPITIQPTEKNITELSNKIWYVLENDPNQSNQSYQIIKNTNDNYFLCKNDVIKLGRVKYSLNEINISSRQNQMTLIILIFIN